MDLKKFALFAALCLFISPNAFAACKDDPKIVGECFSVHGRMFNANGNPTTRIWPVGTKRILGVSERDENGMPPGLQKLMPDFDTVLYGDFVLCPFEPEKPGVMRFVCVESYSHILAKPRHPPQ